MYAVTGITGKVGGVVARTLLDAGLSVRAVVRDAAKGDAWRARGCEVALADVNDAPTLTAAFTGVDGVFVLIPSNFDPTPGFPEVRTIITALTTAIEAAKPPKVVCLSTIGAQATQPNLLNQLGLVEQALGALPLPVCFLRAAQTQILNQLSSGSTADSWSSLVYEMKKAQMERISMSSMATSLFSLSPSGCRKLGTTPRSRAGATFAWQHVEKGRNKTRPLILSITAPITHSVPHPQVTIR